MTSETMFAVTAVFPAAPTVRTAALCQSQRQAASHSRRCGFPLQCPSIVARTDLLRAR